VPTQGGHYAVPNVNGHYYMERVCGLGNYCCGGVQQQCPHGYYQPSTGGRKCLLGYGSASDKCASDCQCVMKLDGACKMRPGKCRLGIQETGQFLCANNGDTYKSIYAATTNPNNYCKQCVGATVNTAVCAAGFSPVPSSTFCASRRALSELETEQQLLVVAPPSAEQVQEDAKAILKEGETPQEGTLWADAPPASALAAAAAVGLADAAGISLAADTYAPGVRRLQLAAPSAGTVWSAVPASANAVCNDADLETKNDKCVAATVGDDTVCAGTPLNCDKTCSDGDGSICAPRPGYSMHASGCGCQIGPTAVEQGEVRSVAKPCQLCDRYKSSTTWSHKANNAQCDDLDFCTYNDRCMSGECTGTAYTCSLQSCEMWSHPTWGEAAIAADAQKQCNGAGPNANAQGCNKANRPSSFQCRPQRDACTPRVTCPGSAGTCPPYIPSNPVVTSGAVSFMGSNANVHKSPLSGQYYLTSTAANLPVSTSGWSLSCDDTFYSVGLFDNGAAGWTASSCSASRVHSMLPFTRVASMTALGDISVVPSAHLPSSSGYGDGKRYVAVVGAHGIDIPEMPGPAVPSYGCSPVIMVDSSPPAVPSARAEAAKMDAGVVAAATGNANYIYSCAGPTCMGATAASCQSHVGVQVGGFVDPHSGVAQYKWRAGTTAGGDNIIPDTTTRATAGSFLFKQPAAGNLVDGSDVHITVWAINDAGLQSAPVSASSWRYDCTAPVIGSGTAKLVADSLAADAASKTWGTLAAAHAITAQISASAIVAHWGAISDVHSSIASVQIALGTTSSPAAVQVFTSLASVADQGGAFSGFTLALGVGYVVTVLARDAAGNTATVTSNPVTIDFTAPTAGRTLDIAPFVWSDAAVAGSSPESFAWAASQDQEWTGVTSAVAVVCRGFQEAQSTFMQYEVAVGTGASGAAQHDVLDWLVVSGGSLTSATTLGSLQSSLVLTNGDKYYTSCRVSNSLGLSTTTVSDGFTVDTVSPVFSWARDTDGVDASTDLTWSSSAAVLNAAWQVVAPPSGIHFFDFKVQGGAAAITAAGKNLRQWTRVTPANAQFVHLAGLPLEDNTQYQVDIRATAFNGHVVQTSTDGVTVDTTPCVGLTAAPFDGPTQGRDTDFQSHLQTQISVNYPMGINDPTSGCTMTWQFVLASDVNNILFQRDLSAAELTSGVAQLTTADFTWQNNVQYASVVFAVNGAGLVSGPFVSSGLTVTDIRPVIGRVVDLGVLKNGALFDAAVQRGVYTLPTGRAADDASILSPLDVDGQPNVTSIAAGWAGVFDSMSGVTQLHSRVYVRSAPRTLAVGVPDVSAYDVFEDWSELLSVATPGISAADLTAGVHQWTNLSLPFDDTHVVVALRATNAAGLTRVMYADGVAVSRNVFSAPNAEVVVVNNATYGETVFTSVSNSVSLAWHGFPHFPAFPIERFTWFLGSATGKADIVAPIDVGVALSDTVTGLSFVDGQEFVATVQAFRGEGVAVNVSSTSIVVDKTACSVSAPTVTVVSPRLIQVAFLATDAQSGIASTRVALGTTAGGTQLLPFTQASGFATPAESLADRISFAASGMAFDYPDGAPLFASIECTNNAGLAAIAHAGGAGAAVDTSPPVSVAAPVVVRAADCSENAISDAGLSARSISGGAVHSDTAAAGLACAFPRWEEPHSNVQSYSAALYRLVTTAAGTTSRVRLGSATTVTAASVSGDNICVQPAADFTALAASIVGGARVVCGVSATNSAAGGSLVSKLALSLPGVIVDATAPTVSHPVLIPGGGSHGGSALSADAVLLDAASAYSAPMGPPDVWVSHIERGITVQWAASDQESSISAVRVQLVDADTGADLLASPLTVLPQGTPAGVPSTSGGVPTMLSLDTSAASVDGTGQAVRTALLAGQRLQLNLEVDNGAGVSAQLLAPVVFAFDANAPDVGTVDIGDAGVAVSPGTASPLPLLELELPSALHSCCDGVVGITTLLSQAAAGTAGDVLQSRPSGTQFVRVAFAPLVGWVSLPLALSSWSDSQSGVAAISVNMAQYGVLGNEVASAPLQAFAPVSPVAAVPSTAAALLPSLLAPASGVAYSLVATARNGADAAVSGTSAQLVVFDDSPPVPPAGVAPGAVVLDGVAAGAVMASAVVAPAVAASLPVSSADGRTVAGVSRTADTFACRWHPLNDPQSGVVQYEVTLVDVSSGATLLPFTAVPRTAASSSGMLQYAVASTGAFPATFSTGVVFASSPDVAVLMDSPLAVGSVFGALSDGTVGVAVRLATPAADGSRVQCRLRAANAAGLTAEFASPGLIVDSTPPVSTAQAKSGSAVAPSVSTPATVASAYDAVLVTASLLVDEQSGNPSSGLQVAVGTVRGNDDVVAWKALTLPSALQSALDLVGVAPGAVNSLPDSAFFALREEGVVAQLAADPSTPLFVGVRASNGAGAMTTAWSAGGLTRDTTGPIAGQVALATHVGGDNTPAADCATVVGGTVGPVLPDSALEEPAFVSGFSSVTVRACGFADAESGIAQYSLSLLSTSTGYSPADSSTSNTVHSLVPAVQLAVGSTTIRVALPPPSASATGPQTVTFQQTGAVSVTGVTSTQMHGRAVFAVVTATNGAGSAVVSASRPVLVDAVPPTVGVVCTRVTNATTTAGSALTACPADEGEPIALSDCACGALRSQLPLLVTWPSVLDDVSGLDTLQLSIQALPGTSAVSAPVTLFSKTVYSYEAASALARASPGALTSIARAGTAFQVTLAGAALAQLQDGQALVATLVATDRAGNSISRSSVQRTVDGSAPTVTTPVVRTVPSNVLAPTAIGVNDGIEITSDVSEPHCEVSTYIACSCVWESASQRSLATCANVDVSAVSPAQPDAVLALADGTGVCAVQLRRLASQAGGAATEVKHSFAGVTVGDLVAALPSPMSAQDDSVAVSHAASLQVVNTAGLSSADMSLNASALALPAVSTVTSVVRGGPVPTGAVLDLEPGQPCSGGDVDMRGSTGGVLQVALCWSHFLAASGSPVPPGVGVTYEVAVASSVSAAAKGAFLQVGSATNATVTTSAAQDASVYYACVRATSTLQGLASMACSDGFVVATSPPSASETMARGTLLPPAQVAPAARPALAALTRSDNATSTDPSDALDGVAASSLSLLSTGASPSRSTVYHAGDGAPVQAVFATALLGLAAQSFRAYAGSAPLPAAAALQDYVADSANVALQHRCWLLRVDDNAAALAAALPEQGTAAFAAADGVATAAPAVLSLLGGDVALPATLACSMPQALHLDGTGTWSVQPLVHGGQYRVVVTASVPVPDANAQLVSRRPIPHLLQVDSSPTTGSIVELGDPADTSAAQQAADAVAASLAASSGDSSSSTGAGNSAGVVSIDDLAAAEAAALAAIQFHAFTTLDVLPLPILRVGASNMTAPQGSVSPAAVVTALTQPELFDLDYVTTLAQTVQLYVDVVSSAARGITTPQALAATFPSGLGALDGSCQSVLNASLPVAWSLTDSDSCVEWLALAVGSDPANGLVDDILPFIPVPAELSSASLQSDLLAQLPDGTTVFPVLTSVSCSGTATWVVGNGITLTQSLSVDASGTPLVCLGAPGGGTQPPSASDDFRARELQAPLQL